MQFAASFQALPGYILGTQALTAGGAGAPNFTSYSGVALVVYGHADDPLHGVPGQFGVAGLHGRRARCAGQTSRIVRGPARSPGTVMTPRVTQLDFSISKRLTFGGVKIDPKLDIFNALNSDDYFRCVRRPTRRSRTRRTRSR